MNSCFQPDIRGAPGFYIGSDTKVVELALKSPSGRRFNRYTFLHCVIYTGSRANFCVFQKRFVRPSIVCWSVPIGASGVLAREEKFDRIGWAVAEPRFGKNRHSI